MDQEEINGLLALLATHLKAKHAVLPPKQSNLLRIEYLSKADTARTLGCSPRTVERYVQQGLLEKFMRGKRVVFPRHQVESLVERWRK